MSFLAPWFLAGAAAVALPFLFHLIRRSAKERIAFSSLMFLEASPPRITKRSRLEHILLLLLRCAVICLIALAFARPFLSTPSAAAFEQGQTLKAAILVDISASMRREDLWNQAKELAIEAARELPDEAHAALFAFDRRPRALLPFSETSGMSGSQFSAAVQARLNAAGPGFGSTHFGGALIGAAELLADELNREGSEFGRGRIVLISDLQAGGRIGGLQGFEWPARMEIELKPVEPANPSNAGLHLLAAERRLGFAATNAPPRVRVQNSAGSQREQFRVTWARNGAPEGAVQPLYVPPGESRIVSMPEPPAGASELLLLDDPAAFDNRAWWVPRPIREIAILYHGTEAAGDQGEPLYFLNRVFEQSGSALSVVPFDQPLTNQEAGLMIATAPLAGASLKKAREMLGQGRTVLAVLRDLDAARALAPLLGIAELPATEAEVNEYALLGRIDFTHPLFRPFSDPRYSDFTKIHFWSHRQIDLSALTNAVIAAEFDSGAPFLTEIPSGRGRVLVMAAGWAPSESQLALSSKFVPLMYGILEQSLGEGEGEARFTVGQAPPITAAGTITGPGGEVFDPAEGGLPRPGVYQSAGPEPFRFAVNLDPAETRVEPLQIETLEALGVPVGGPARTEASPEELAARKQHRLATEAEARQKFWRYVLIGAVGFVLLESILAGRLSRSASPAGA